jgi:hypothetical protein
MAEIMKTAERKNHLVCFYCGHLKSEHASPWELSAAPECIGKIKNYPCECAHWKPIPHWEYQEMIMNEEEWIEKYGLSMRPNISMWEKIRGWFQ